MQRVDHEPQRSDDSMKQKISTHDTVYMKYIYCYLD